MKTSVSKPRVKLISLVNLRRPTTTTTTTTTTTSKIQLKQLQHSTPTILSSTQSIPTTTTADNTKTCCYSYPSTSTSLITNHQLPSLIINSCNRIQRSSSSIRSTTTIILPNLINTNNQLRLYYNSNNSNSNSNSNNIQSINQLNRLNQYQNHHLLHHHPILRNIFTQPNFNHSILTFFEPSIHPNLQQHPSSSHHQNFINNSSIDCVCYNQPQPKPNSSPSNCHQNHSNNSSSPRKSSNTSNSSPSSTLLPQSSQSKSQNPNHQSSSSSSSSSSSNNKFTGSINSNLVSLTQFNHLNIYPTSADEPNDSVGPSIRSVLPRKTFYLFRNGASGIPKSSPTSSPSLFLMSSSSSTTTPTTSTQSTHGTDGYGDRVTRSSSSRKDQSINRSSPSCSTYRAVNSVQIGEDSYFLRNDSLGVADGVGGWSGKPGANAGLFSSKLMNHCYNEISRYENTEDDRFQSYNDIDPVEILQRAFEMSIYESKDEGILGSSTALVAILRNDELRIANIGDCCCSIIRGNDYIFRTEEQQHSFNYPVQIGTNSKSVPIRDAQRYKVKVQKDDVVILSSDGLVDNLFDEDILEEVLKFTKPRNRLSLRSASGTSEIKSLEEEGMRLKGDGVGSSSSSSNRGNENGRTKMIGSVPELISKSLCIRAKTVIDDQQAITSPFAQRASEEGIHYVGGKNDDISVLVAIVGALES
ncbi:expressed protein [Phakopsora pachyrhizi]|uniref:Protein phosphatase n=1 Tax=Phakopsora pachyrhizi TaxID=170000 RepID=A0AAV0BK63_PHAPC|nr:expressed protein [Phakopsora pachyrhizi]